MRIFFFCLSQTECLVCFFIKKKEKKGIFVYFLNFVCFHSGVSGLDAISTGRGRSGRSRGRPKGSGGAAKSGRKGRGRKSTVGSAAAMAGARAGAAAASAAAFAAAFSSYSFSVSKGEPGQPPRPHASVFPSVSSAILSPFQPTCRQPATCSRPWLAAAPAPPSTPAEAPPLRSEEAPPGPAPTNSPTTASSTAAPRPSGKGRPSRIQGCDDALVSVHGVHVQDTDLLSL